MIDASYFSAAYTAFWSEYTPACEHFIRAVNIRGAKRYANPILPDEKLRRPQFVAEYAFSLFVERMKLGEWSPSIEVTAHNETVRRMANFEEGRLLKLRLGGYEQHEAYEIYHNISTFFRGKHKGFIARPRFLGCGFIDESEGDIINGGTIYEIKTVERGFRSSDLRQVITYAALNFSSKQFEIERIALVNPRKGVYFSYDLADACSEISGMAGYSLLEFIVSTISSGQSSR